MDTYLIAPETLPAYAHGSRVMNKSYYKWYAVVFMVDTHGRVVTDDVLRNRAPMYQFNVRLCNPWKRATDLVILWIREADVAITTHDVLTSSLTNAYPEFASAYFITQCPLQENNRRFTTACFFSTIPAKRSATAPPMDAQEPDKKKIRLDLTESGGDGSGGQGGEDMDVVNEKGVI